MEQPGSAYDPTLFEFTTDVTNDQSKEIELMHGLLLGLSDDPRASLAAGLYDAEEAIWNLRKVAVLTKPPGFYDPANPAELPPERFMPTVVEATTDEKAAEEQEAHAHHHGEEHVDGSDDMGAQAKAQAEENADEDSETEADETPDPRSPLLSFSNTDIAFRDNIMVAGSYHGFNIYALGDDGQPDLMASVVCPGGQGDVSIVDDLLIMSVEETRGRVDCGLEGVTDEISNERFRGLRIFDISDLTRPKQVGAVQTCRGSHTHSVVSGPGEDGVIVAFEEGVADRPQGQAAAVQVRAEADQHKADMEARGFIGAFLTTYADGAPAQENATEANNEVDTPQFDADKVNFRIQLGALKDQVSTEALNAFLAVGEVEHRAAPGWHRYFQGQYGSVEEARIALPQMQAAGFPDAFVVGEVAGRIVPVAEALILLED